MLGKLLLMALIGLIGYHFYKRHNRSGSKVRVAEGREESFLSSLLSSLLELSPDKDPIKVKRHDPPYWVKRGWEKVNGGLEGYYRTRFGSFKGKITEIKEDDFKFFIFDPPVQLDNHPHEKCFIPWGNGKYKVHFNPEPTDLDSGIQSIEKILKEAMEG